VFKGLKKSLNFKPRYKKYAKPQKVVTPKCKTCSSVVVFLSKSKGKVVPVHAIRAYKGSRSTDPLILNFNIKKGKVIPLQARCGPEGG
jgi:hypothetical protein